jgi:hypothetical protein
MQRRLAACDLRKSQSLRGEHAPRPEMGAIEKKKAF